MPRSCPPTVAQPVQTSVRVLPSRSGLMHDRALDEPLARALDGDGRQLRRCVAGLDRPGCLERGQSEVEHLDRAEWSFEDVGDPPLTSMQVAAVIVDDDDRVDPLERDCASIASEGAFELIDIFGERVFLRDRCRATLDLDRVMQGSTEVPAITVPPGSEVSDIVIVLRRR